MIFYFLQPVPIENKVTFCSSESELVFMSICSVRISFRNKINSKEPKVDKQKLTLFIVGV